MDWAICGVNESIPCSVCMYARNAFQNGWTNLDEIECINLDTRGRFPVDQSTYYKINDVISS